MHGVINVYKEPGMTSFDVVMKVKKIAHTKKVGHTGTLDPLATGVLPVCIGNATKIVDYIMSDYKVYKAEMKLGLKSTTLDVEGEIISERQVDVDSTDVCSAINSFIGEIKQIPPMYSAIKVNGKRLYELARQGKEIERESRNIKIYSIEITKIELPLVEFVVKCSKGTYIRTLIDDIGEKLNCGAIMTKLERTSSGNSFNLSNSFKLSELEGALEEKLISIEDALSKYEAVTFIEDARKLLINGVRIGNKKIIGDTEKGKLFRVYCGEEFLGLGSRDDDGFKMIKLLF